MPQGINFDGLVQAIDRISIVSQIPLSILEENGETVYCVPNSYHHYLPADVAKKEIRLYHTCNFPERFPLMHDLELNLIIGLIPLSNNRYLFVGPISPSTITLEALTAKYGYLLNYEEMVVIYRIVNQSMKCDSVRFANILSSLSFSLYQDNILPMEIIQNNFTRGAFESAEEDHIDEGLSTTTAPLFADLESISLFESSLISAICFGNIDALSAIWDRPQLVTNNTLDSPERLQFYFMVPLLTLISRSAVSSGADAGKCFSLYDETVPKLMKIHHLSDALSILMEISFQYCYLVRETTGKNTLPDACRLCEKYINEHITEKITAEQLSKLCGLSKKKLYEVFEAYFHTTINDYIQRERLRRARILMESTNYTLAQISSSLGYASQSYFTSVFAKYYGYTPGEYQTMKKYEVFPEGD